MKKKRIIYLSLILGLTLILFFGLGNDILFAKKGILGWIPLIIIFLLIPSLISLFLEDFNFPKIKQRGISIGSVLIIGPLFGFWIGYLSKKNFKKMDYKLLELCLRNLKVIKKTETQMYGFLNVILVQKVRCLVHSLKKTLTMNIKLVIH